MKKQKLDRELVGKNDTEFSSEITPGINGGRKSISHLNRWAAGKRQPGR